MAGAYMPAASSAAGSADAFPDTCNVPSSSGSVPTPFTNTAQCAATEGGAETVLIENVPAVVVGAEISVSSGDESGSAGGVTSGTVASTVTYMQGSSKVLVQGRPLVVLTNVTAHNGVSANAPAGTLDCPSQAKVLAAL
jgi:hypothetical protein